MTWISPISSWGAGLSLNFLRNLTDAAPKKARHCLPGFFCQYRHPSARNEIFPKKMRCVPPVGQRKIRGHR